MKSMLWLSIRLGFWAGTLMALIEFALGWYIDRRIEQHLGKNSYE